ncbi:MAG: hypothetical protein CL912_12430 [Deltaproteobacteria bacterium]|nr:hypothetical protein [Deltaproteobacteria bacterium]
MRCEVVPAGEEASCEGDGVDVDFARWDEDYYWADNDGAEGDVAVEGIAGVERRCGGCCGRGRHDAWEELRFVRTRIVDGVEFDF